MWLISLFNQICGWILYSTNNTFLHSTPPTTQPSFYRPPSLSSIFLTQTWTVRETLLVHWFVAESKSFALKFIACWHISAEQSAVNNRFELFSGLRSFMNQQTGCFLYMFGELATLLSGPGRFIITLTREFPGNRRAMTQTRVFYESLGD